MRNVAVVVPNLNGTGIVGRCVAAAVTGGAADVVVVDDGSSDESPAEAVAAGAAPGRPAAASRPR